MRSHDYGRVKGREKLWKIPTEVQQLEESEDVVVELEHSISCSIPTALAVVLAWLAHAICWCNEDIAI